MLFFSFSSSFSIYLSLSPKSPTFVFLTRIPLWLVNQASGRTARPREIFAADAVNEHAVDDNNLSYVVLSFFIYIYRCISLYILYVFFCCESCFALSVTILFGWLKLIRFLLQCCRWTLFCEAHIGNRPSGIRRILRNAALLLVRSLSLSLSLSLSFSSLCLSVSLYVPNLFIPSYLC